MIRRHNHLQGLVVHMGRDAGTPSFVLATNEVINPDVDSRMIPDVRIAGFDPAQGASIRDIDISFCAVNLGSAHARTPTTIVKNREESKKRKYRQLYDMDDGSFGAFVMSTSGGFGEDAIKIVKDVAGAAAELTGVSRSSFTSRWRKILSCGLARAQFEYLRASCAVFRGTLAHGSNLSPFDDSVLDAGEFLDFGEVGD